MTAAEFTRVVGRPPEQDDLDRANCIDAGKDGHHQCGICNRHGLPVFLCRECCTDCYDSNFPRQQVRPTAAPDSLA